MGVREVVGGNGNVPRSTRKALVTMIMIAVVVVPLSLASTVNTSLVQQATRPAPNQQPETTRNPITAPPMLLWKQTAGGQVWTHPAVADLFGNGKLEVVVESSNYVCCLTGTTGAWVWSYHISNVWSSPAVADLFGDGKPEVVAGSFDKSVYCLNGTTGGRIWSYATGGEIFSSPAVADLFGDGKPEVIVGSNTNVYCLNGTTGVQVWSYTTQYAVSSSPAVADLFGNGKLEVIVAGNSIVYCLNGTTGDELWSHVIAGSVYSSSAVADLFGNGKLEVVAGASNGVYCLNGTTGSELWSYPTSAYSPPAVADLFGNGKLEVVVGSFDNSVYCLDGTTGGKLWSYATGGMVYSSPAVADLFADGKPEVIVGSDDMYVYCIKLTPPDNTPPAAITDLSVSSTGDRSANLNWTAPGDDGTQGNATGYVVKYSAIGRITVANWSTAKTYTQYWEPVKNGTLETHVVTGLSSETKYWFAVEAFDEELNYAAVSNSPNATTLPDTTPPAAINSLATGSLTGSSVTLNWTAPGDDDMAGNATGYWVKYSTSGSITAANWASATNYTQSWTPAKNGTTETYAITGLSAGTKYWFAVEAYDEVPNYGGVSNSPNATTLSTSDTTPPAAINNLATGSVTGSSVTLNWTAPGDDDMAGNATGYWVKYSTSGEINATNWDSATNYTQSWKPAKNGTTDTHVVTGLSPGTTYWFAVKAYDEVMPPNYGAISNSPSATTTSGGGSGTDQGISVILIATAVAVTVAVVLVAVVLVKKGRTEMR